jgi:polyhydroxybutyrate depolymerase
MRRLFRLGAVSLLLFTAGPAAQGQGQSGRIASHTWSVGGVARTALVATPITPAPSSGAPLVLIFHGHGGTSAHSARTFAIHTHWPDAVVIYAQGLPTPGRLSDPAGQRPGWQHAPGEQGDRDLKFVDAMIEWARSTFSIDQRRIYAGGHSNGGTMTYVLWVARGDVFAALAPSASVFRRDLLRVAKPKPALIIAGEKDELVPFAGQRLSLQAMLRLNGASATGLTWSAGAVLHKAPSGADVAAYIHSGDHTMPGDAGALMVKFFKEHAGRGPLAK